MPKNLDRVSRWGFVLALLPIPLVIMDLQSMTPELMAALFFVVLPVCRLIRPIGYPESNDEDGLPWLQEKILYWLPFAYSVLWLATLLAIPVFLDLGGRSELGIGLLWLSLWIAFSLALPSCHELIHRRTWVETFAGRVLASSVGVFMFTEEHKTHHMLSGRGADPDAAEEDEGIYHYNWRTHWAGVHAAWEWEIGAQIRQSRSAWSNRVLWSGAITLAIGAWFCIWLGLPGALLYFSLCIGANFSIRSITYIQHWGLKRVPLLCGGEGVAWTSTCIFQSWVLFNIAFHQDHHTHPTRIYYHLRSDTSSLKLPFSYPIAFLVALVPPLYRKIMGPRLAAWVASKTAGDEPLVMQEGCLIPKALS